MKAGDTYNIVVLAAHHVGRASIARANTDDSDRGAVETEKDINAFDDDAEEAQKEAADGVASLLNKRSPSVFDLKHEDTRTHLSDVVAALNGPGAARRRRGVGGVGGRKEGESEESDSADAREHLGDGL